MTPASNADRQRAWRERVKAGKAQSLEPCLECGRLINLGQVKPDSPRGQSRLGRALCAGCWRKTPEGRASREAQARARRKRKREQKGQE